ncbi:MAG: SMP-30/gluconolactonase/LRE family protein [Pseudomonadota bacterium]
MDLESRRAFIDEGIVFPESPRWRDGALWFVDMLVGRIMRASLDGVTTVVAQHESWLSGLGWRADGECIVVAMEDRRLLALSGERLVEAADLTPLTRMHTNDMVVDAQGRAYIGEVGFDIHGGEPQRGANLVRVTPDGDVTIAASELACPNGAVIVDDGRTLIVAETLADRLTAFDISPDGELTNRRIWAEFPGYGPDGICADADGGIWVACPFAGAVFRVLEGGRKTHAFETDDVLPLACILGGPERRHLFICYGLHPDEAQKIKGGGRIEVVETDAPGVGLP